MACKGSGVSELERLVLDCTYYKGMDEEYANSAVQINEATVTPL